jgi:NAD(P)-dependent dehydrogenase (short-subunit alcohol dehydrogenase family)
MELNIRLDDKIAIVTGAARGIGQGIAHGIASVGAHVIVADIEEGVAQDTARKIVNDGGRSEAYKLDVTKSDQFESMVEYIIRQHGRIDILVNNAGINRRKLVVDTSEKDWNDIINVNLTSVFMGCKAVIPIMTAQNRGKIVNICSIMGIVSLPKLSAYSASKGGIVQLTKNLALELAQHNIQVNAVAPGWILTEKTRKMKDNKIMYDDIIGRVPMKRFGTIEEVAGPVVFLCSDLSNFMTGHTMPVDGGWLAW